MRGDRADDEPLDPEDPDDSEFRDFQDYQDDQGGQDDQDDQGGQDYPGYGTDDADSRLPGSRARAVPHPLDRIWRHPSELGGRRSTRRPRRRRSFGTIGAPLAAGAFGALGTIGVLALAGLLGGEARGPEAAAERVAEDEAAVAQLVAEASPAVVAVTALGGDAPWRGSGVCLRHRGEVLTSARLVSGASTITVTDARGRERKARVVGRDRDTDLALLSVDSALSAARLGERRLAPGDRVLVVGAPPPGGDENWVSSGVVAAVDATAGDPGGPVMQGLLETDAAPGEGAAGGALLDRAGAVVGIVLAPLDGRPGAYALPIDTAVALADQLRRDGEVEHGWLGLEGVDTPAGATVTELTEGGPAAEAGILVGDVVVEVDDRRVMTIGEVIAAARHSPIGEDLMLKVRRSGALVGLDARVSLPPEEPTPTTAPTQTSAA